MTLVHVRKEDVNEFGVHSWVLYDPTGIRMTVFTEFCRKLDGLKYATRLRYTTVAARFIDYLYEVKVLGGKPVTRAVINKSIDYYLSLLKSGENISLSSGMRDRTTYADGDQEREVALRDVARKLDIKPLATNSWDNTLAAINRFLHLCAILEREAKEMAILRGNVKPHLVDGAERDCVSLLEAVDGVTSLSKTEIYHIKNTTLLGGVIRFRGNDLERPKGLKQSSRQQSQIDVNSLDFPSEYFPDLIVNATSWRDRTLWTLLFASGIRRSEALNLQWCDIDFINREVYVFDPALMRYGRDITPVDRELRFKGRNVSQTYLRQPYKDWFFNYLAQYRRNEYRLPLDDNDFVFQYLISPYHGRPLYEATDETLNSAFTATVRRANIPGPPINRNYTWTAHSLRHAYAKFMSNDFKIPGQTKPGLTEAEIQLLMGHKNIASTRRYSKLKDNRLREKLLLHDEIYVQGIEVLTCPLIEV